MFNSFLYYFPQIPDHSDLPIFYFNLVLLSIKWFMLLLLFLLFCTGLSNLHLAWILPANIIIQHIGVVKHHLAVSFNESFFLFFTDNWVFGLVGLFNRLRLSLFQRAGCISLWFIILYSNKCVILAGQNGRFCICHAYIWNRVFIWHKGWLFYTGGSGWMMKCN